MAGKDETQSVLKAAWLIALVTIASKFMGFVRDMVVANYYGATISARANFKLSMSKMTFLHQFARLLLVEQIYRAFKILKNETYHK